MKELSQYIPLKGSTKPAKIIETNQISYTITTHTRNVLERTLHGEKHNAQWEQRPHSLNSLRILKNATTILGLIELV